MWFNYFLCIFRNIIDLLKLLIASNINILIVIAINDLLYRKFLLDV